MDRLRPGARNVHLGQTIGKATKASSQKKYLLRRDEIFSSLAAGTMAKQSEGLETHVGDLERVRAVLSVYPHPHSYFVSIRLER